MRTFAAFVFMTCLVAACGERRQGGASVGGGSPRDQPPVALDAVPPVEYPPALYAQGIEGRVVLRLFLDSAGVVVSESTTVQESSGVPGLDSAALAAVPRLRFAPALRDGKPAASPFLQPFDFRRNRDSVPAGGQVTP
ncbi:MAG: energy transducer TonB [Gemmatimonadales bacterium]